MTKVLIADDDKLSRKLLQTTLEKAGYEVVAVEEGAAAGRILCEPGAPRLALLDWMMPGLDGPAVIRVVRSQEGMADVHMILLTSRQSKDDLIAGLEAGADDYLTKPFHPEELRARLHTGERILQLGDKFVEGREEMRFKGSLVQTGAGVISMSMSLGVAGANDWEQQNSEQLIHEADLALYRAKATGRNRVVLAKPSGLLEIQQLKPAEDPVHVR